MALGFVSLAMLDASIAPVRPYAPLLVIALGLIGLAWLERSRLLGVISALFTGAALLVNLYNMENVVVGGLVAWFGGRSARA